MARSRNLAVAEARPCAFVFRALLLYRRVLICPSDSFHCHVQSKPWRESGHVIMLCASDCIRAKRLCIRLCIRVSWCFCGFVHCIVHFPCTILQVVIVLNTQVISLRDSWESYYVHVNILCQLPSLSQVRWHATSFGFLPPHCVAGGGGYFKVVLVACTYL